jgi:hypothetical protein
LCTTGDFLGWLASWSLGTAKREIGRVPMISAKESWKYSDKEINGKQYNKGNFGF